MCLGNLFSQAGYIGLDVQLNIIITQRIAEYLFEDICAVQGILVRAGDEVINGDREGDAQSGQFLDGLLLILFGFVRIQAGNGLTVDFRQSQLLADQLGVVGTVRGAHQIATGKSVVFTL